MMDSLPGVSHVVLRTKLSPCHKIAKDELTHLESYFALSVDQLICEIAQFIFDATGCFCTASSEDVLPKPLYERVSVRRKVAFANYQALIQGTIDDKVRASLQRKGAYSANFSEERRRVTYDCLSHLPMPVQQMHELQVVQPAVVVHPQDKEMIEKDASHFLKRIIQLFDVPGEYYPANGEPMVFLEKCAWRHAALCRAEPKSGDMSFTNWITLIREWDASQDALGFEGPSVAVRKSRLPILSSLAGLAENEAPREPLVHDEIDAKLKTAGITLKDYFIWSAIKELCFTIEFPLSGPVLQMLYDDLAAKPAAALDLMYFSALGHLDFNKLPCDEVSKKWISIFRRFRFIKGWTPASPDINLNWILLWVIHGKSDFQGDRVPDDMLSNGVKAYQATVAVAEKLALPLSACLGIFSVCIAYSNCQEMVPALETVDTLLKLKNLERPGPEFWHTTCKQLAPWKDVEEYGKLFGERLKDAEITELPFFTNCLQVFLSGAITAFETGMEAVVSEADLRWVFSRHFIPLVFPLNPAHVRVCISHLKACSRYNWSVQERLLLFFNFLGSRDRKGMIEATYAQLCWIEKFSFCPLPPQHAFHWLMYHPEPNTVWAIFKELERLKAVCDKEFMDEPTIPDQFKTEFVECRRALANIPSAFKQMEDYDGFQFSINAIRLQIAFPVMSVTSQWWTDLFTYKAFEDNLAGQHNPRTEHFISAITPFGGSQKYVCCSWDLPPPPYTKEEHEHPIFEIRIITNFATRTIRRRFPCLPAKMTKDNFGQVISAHASFFGEESADETHRPKQVIGILQEYFEQVRVACRRAWKSPTEPLPFTASVYELNRVELAAQGNVYPIDGGLSLVPPDLLLTEDDFARYTVRENDSDLPARIAQLMQTKQDEQLDFGPLDTRLRESLSALKVTERDTPDFELALQKVFTELGKLWEACAEEGLERECLPKSNRLYGAAFRYVKQAITNFKNDPDFDLDAATTLLDEMKLFALRVRYETSALEQEEADAPAYHLHRLTLRHGPDSLSFRYLELADGPNLEKWIRWHLLQLKAQRFQRMHAC